MRPMLATSGSVAAAVLLLVVAGVAANEETHDYNDGEAVQVWANKIGPFNNPLETYAYFELPGCPPASLEHKFPTLGQVLAGDEIYETNIKIKFGESSRSGGDMSADGDKLCDFKPTAEQAERWRSMVKEQYWYQLGIDGLPTWASFGKMLKGDPQVYTHQHFTIGRNGNRIVLVNLTATKPKPIAAGETYSFEYSVTFTDRKDIAFVNRYRRYLDSTFSEHRIRWFSIFNAFMTVLFLSGMVLTILSRTLRQDYARYAQKDKELDALGPNAEWADETGWKQLHGDVFRVPKRPELLAALIGTGWQLVIFVLACIAFALFAMVYMSPGVLTTYAVFAYTVTSFIGGWTSGKQFGEYAALNPAITSGWMRCMLLQATIFPGGVLVTGFMLNFVAIAYDSAQAIAFGGMVVMLLIWLALSVPAVVGSTILARMSRARSKAELPRVHQVPRLIPEQPWYFNWVTLAVAGGVMPFGSIFIELYFIFTSFWGYTTYYVYGFLLLVFVMLLFVTACVAVVATYFMLNWEEHRWQWSSFVIGASVSVYVFIYAVYFYWFKTRMTGFFMFAFYFTYMAMMSIGLGLLCGAVGFSAASMFVNRIFRNVKAD